MVVHILSTHLYVPDASMFGFSVVSVGNIESILKLVKVLVKLRLSDTVAVLLADRFTEIGSVINTSSQYTSG